MTANWANISKILNQMPIFSARSATALRVSQTNFWASRRISTQLLSSAKKGARGKAATKMVMKPNCNTATRKNRIKYAWNALFNNLEKIMSLIKKWIKGRNVTTATSFSLKDDIVVGNHSKMPHFTFFSFWRKVETILMIFQTLWLDLQFPFLRSSNLHVLPISRYSWKSPSFSTSL